MWNMQLFGTDIYHILNWFFIYSILGWVVESLYMSYCFKKPTNRGFIHGPICPIYGVGALSVYFILRPLEGNYIALYFCGTALATTLEFLTAKIMIKVFGAVWWDYKDKPFNYKGILCLESTIAWGFYTVIMFAFLQKIVMWIAGGYSVSVGKKLVVLLFLYYITDFCYCIFKAKKNEGLDREGILVEENR